jgi:glycosyltransferase involved in cell wall biosynthesis
LNPASVVIAIPTRNSAATLAATLESALAQEALLSKILVIDNESTDETVKIAGAFAQRDLRVEVVKFNELVSGEDNFNRCLRLAGEVDYIAILHSDDIFGPEMISRQVAFLEAHPASVVVFTHAMTINEAGAVTGERFLPEELSVSDESELSSAELFRLVLKYGNFLTCPSALMRTSIFRDQLGGWRGLEFGSSSDLDLWLRASEVGKIGFLRAPLMNYRISRWSFSVALSKVRVTSHPMLKVIAAHIERRRSAGSAALNAPGNISLAVALDSNDLWNWRFLQTKDAAFLRLNHLKLGLKLPPAIDSDAHLCVTDFMRAMARSRFHRRFALRILAIDLMGMLAKIPGLLGPIEALASRIKVQ